MAGLVYDRASSIYRLTTLRLDRDTTLPPGFDATTPGGVYLRLPLIGDPPDLYDQIAGGFDELFEHAGHDPSRPLIEYYHGENRVDCLVPVR